MVMYSTMSLVMEMRMFPQRSAKRMYVVRLPYMKMHEKKSYTLQKIGK